MWSATKPSTAWRITGKKKDDLQAAMQRIRGGSLGIPLQFQNFRE